MRDVDMQREIMRGVYGEKNHNAIITTNKRAFNDRLEGKTRTRKKFQGAKEGKISRDTSKDDKVPWILCNSSYIVQSFWS